MEASILSPQNTMYSRVWRVATILIFWYVREVEKQICRPTLYVTLHISLPSAGRVGVHQGRDSP
jgi:hypothetical protein